MKDTTQKLLVWVRFPCLPIDYYDHDFPMRVGRVIGEPKKVGEATSMASRGLFAMVCVEVDVTKPLLSRFKVRNKIRTIEYEGLHLVCFKCDVVRHKKEECRKSDETNMKATAEIRAVRLGNDEEKSSKKKRMANVEETKNQKLIEEGSEKPDSLYGPWMIANKKSRSYQKRGEALKGNGKANNVKKIPEKAKDGEFKEVTTRVLMRKSSEFGIIPGLSPLRIQLTMWKEMRLMRVVWMGWALPGCWAEEEGPVSRLIRAN